MLSEADSHILSGRGGEGRVMMCHHDITRSTQSGECRERAYESTASIARSLFAPRGSRATRY